MSIFGWPGLAGFSWTEILQIVLDYTLKGTLVCTLAWLFSLLLRRSSAYIRHTIWMFALIALALLPIASFLAPVWHLPLLPALERLGLPSTVDGVAGSQNAIRGPGSGARGPAGQLGPVGLRDASFGRHWSHQVLVVWALGACVTFGWILLSRLALRRIVRRARPLSGSWNELLDLLCAALGLRRKVRLLRAPAIRAGITVGTLRPRVVFPDDAERWSEQRRRLILSHELAHVKRWDALAEELAYLVTVLYWFNPLVWLALKRLRIERERDCDNAVLRAGARPSDYATQLMEIAADISGAARPSWRYEGISQSSNLRDRLLHILDPDVRRAAADRRAVFLVGSLLLSLTLPLAALGLWDDSGTIRHPEGVVLSAKSQEFWSKSKFGPQDQSAAYLIEQLLETSGTDSALAAFEAIASQPPNRRRLRIEELELNALGYRLLNSGRNREAVEIFRLNVDAFPASWNVYDSLGEAYLAAGDLERARRNYRRSLELGSDRAEQTHTILDDLERRKASATSQSDGLSSSMIPASTQ